MKKLLLILVIAMSVSACTTITNSNSNNNENNLSSIPTTPAPAPEESTEESVEETTDKEKASLENLCSSLYDQQESLSEVCSSLYDDQRSLNEANQELKKENMALSSEAAELSERIAYLEESVANQPAPVPSTLPTVMETTASPYADGRVYISEIDYFNKDGTMVKKEDTLDNLGKLRTNTLGVSRVGWEYTYRINKQYRYLRGTAFLTYENRTWTNTDSYVRIYGDGEKLNSISRITAGTDPQSIDTDISNVDELKIVFHGHTSNRVLLSEVYLEP